MKDAMDFRTGELIFIRSPYNYDMNAASDESGLACRDPSMAKQSFAEEADINRIIERWLKTGALPPATAVPTFGDFGAGISYHEAANLVVQAQQAFYELDPSVRARFGNDPGALVAFVSDDSNRAEAEKLGLVLAPRKEEPPPPLKVEVVNPTDTKPAAGPA